MNNVIITLDNSKNTVSVKVEGELPEAGNYNKFVYNLAKNLTTLIGRDWKITMPEDGQYLSVK